MARRSRNMPSVMKGSSRFAQVPRADIPRSRFDRSHGYKTTFDAGYLVPIYVDEALPGDTFNLNLTCFGRLATPLHPIMDNMFLDTFFFAVPIRLLWDNWEKFNGAQENPEDSTDYIIPTMTAPSGGYDEQSLSDYFGIPPGVENLEHSSLWHRAYNLIWNEWFRDQNLQDSVVVDKDDGPDNPADYVLLRRGKRHDYFTSALPWPQKGPSVELPLGDQAPIGASVDESALIDNDGTFNISPTSGGSGASMRIVNEALGSSNYPIFVHGTSTSNTTSTYYSGGLTIDTGNMYADLSEATAATINQIREAFQVQKIYERDARGGTRYTEIVLSHFGVSSPDARLQRPEYLGGGSQPISISPVASTYTADGDAPQGNLAGVGTVVSQKGGFVKSFTEHCILIGLANIRADLTYQQGLDRMFSRSTRFDFYWPALSRIGEQEILNKEIYAQGTSADDDVFGYQERYAEYRYKPSRITGLFRSSASQSLDVWHLSQDFANLPALTSEFIEDDPPIDRVIAVPSEPHVIFDSYFRLKCARPMPVYGVPGLVDHF